MSKATYIILDCDGGSDDAWALLLLLRAEEERKQKGENFSILGITISGCGNTDLRNAARNMMRILKARKREDVPVYLGASESLLPPDGEERPMFHGNDGFGDVLPQEISLAEVEKKAENEHAVNAINRFCTVFPKMVTILAVGPLTNIALCLSMYGKQFAENIHDLYIMGGNYQGVGNFTRSAEFNFYSDPEAAHIVLSKSVCPITVLPWEPCLQDRFFICIRWRLEAFGREAASVCEAINLLNKVEYAQWIPLDVKAWNPCDALLVAAFLFDKQIIKKQSMWHATVDLKGGHTRGQMVLDHLQEVEKNPKNIRIIELVDATFFQKVARWAAGLNMH